MDLAYDPNATARTLAWIVGAVAVVVFLIACVIIYSSPKDKVAKAFRTYAAIRSINDESGRYAKDGFYMVSAVQTRWRSCSSRNIPNTRR